MSKVAPQHRSQQNKTPFCGQWVRNGLKARGEWQRADRALAEGWIAFIRGEAQREVLLWYHPSAQNMPGFGKVFQAA
jgi:hypothetical protein